MERLPYIDEHAITIDANRADTWSALLRVLCRNPDDPATVPIGFVLDEARPPERLALKGRHPFAVYRWVFELDEQSRDRTRLRATTWAAFPGLHGRIYRRLVIGTGGHAVVTRATLKRVAAAAFNERSGATASDYTDVFEATIQPGDRRSAEQMFRDALGRESGGGAVRWIHRHVLRFDLAAHPSTDHPIGWSVARSDHDEMILTTSGPLMRGELALRREDGLRATLTTRVHYHRRLAGRTVWAVVGPLHRAIAPQLVQRAARDGGRRAHAHHS
ncbi:DUF2867 domain-containing protein [Mycobacterium scrofulaceum]|uniref:DUF2867 domain-containing protein n=1 Tax=Mycobacterium scrofulaceum TaxID=1783 RepID=A0A1A2U451_MYCSC|nr:DUF2867 domain-containing protein [Mycobacterium scrofulaceum]OBH83429.1 hypothetical protein A5679_04805 [Mycobacterium scrofulaceum]